MEFRVWRTRAQSRLQHMPGFVFDLQWDSIYVQLRQQFNREPREQDSFSCHCDCDKERRPIHWPETPQNEYLERRTPHLDQRPESDTDKFIHSFIHYIQDCANLSDAERFRREIAKIILVRVHYFELPTLCPYITLLWRPVTRLTDRSFAMLTSGWSSCMTASSSPNSKSRCSVLIAVYEGENAVSSEVRNAVEKLAEYLKTSGY
ncbi:hypothetical protein PRIPAC_75089 [Pristionchus pacificus]|uniref:Uncharacterized protein n=1 Tax=Pristionchus pacificus TaxID=54126 RepID=A0A2A6CF75_PRIPA|nr:hypothetical protein PRIPAC_75089 [Pristionchus pacificus]|eukprot:PDM76895.1 hypothetical protein PRIPAC_42290 [Pristionchus pacificus]